MANHTSLAPISHGYYIYERAKHTPHKRTRTPTRTACADTGTAFIYLDTDALALVLALVLVLAANCELQNLRAPLIDLKLNGWLATLAERTNFHLHFHCLSHSHTHCICNPNCYQQFAIPPRKRHYRPPSSVRCAQVHPIYLVFFQGTGKYLWDTHLHLRPRVKLLFRTNVAS